MPLNLPAHDGSSVSLAAPRAAPLLVVFLPGAFTDPARALLGALPAGVEVVAVLADAVPVLAAFVADTGTAARLLSDPEGAALARLGGQEGGAVLLDARSEVLARFAFLPTAADLAPHLQPRRARTEVKVARWLWLPVGILALFAVVNALGFWTYTTDDAYITMRYAWHLVNGDGLVFNPGERVEGYSNPTWLAVLLLPIAAGWDAMAFGKGLGAVLHGATVVFAALAAWQLARVRSTLAASAALLAASATAVAVPLTWWAAGNLETPFYTCLLTAALWRILVERPDAAPVSALLVGFAGFSRPEAPLMAIGLAATRFLVLGRDRARFLRWGAFAAGPVALWMAFRVVYYGDIVPNTYYHKGGQAGWEELSEYYGPYLRNEWPLVLAFVLGAAGLAVARRERALLVAAPVATHLFFLAMVGGDWMANQRFLAPALPLFAAVGAAGLAALVDRPFPPVPRQAFAALAALLAVAHAARALPVRIAETNNDGAYAVTERDGADWPVTSFRNGFAGSNNVVVTWLLQHIPPGATVAYSEVGLVAYAGGWIVQDLVGLTDRDLGGATGLDVNQRVEVVHQRRPDWIVLREGGTQNIRAVRASTWLREEYDIQEGPKQLLVARRKGAEGATPEQALENLERAVALAPRFPNFHDARIALAMTVGSQGQRQAACDDLAAALPYGQDRIRRCRNALDGKGGYTVKAPAEASAPRATGGVDPAGEVKTGPKKGSLGNGWYVVPRTTDPAVVGLEGDVLVLHATGKTPVPTACKEGDLPAREGMRARWEWSYEGVVLDGKKGGRMTARMLDEAGSVLPGGYTPAGGMQMLKNARGTVDWEIVEVEIPLVSGASAVRVCVDLPAKEGVLRLKSLDVL